MKPTKEILEDLYIAQRLSTRTIATQYSVKHITVRRWIASYGIPARPTGRGLANRGIAAPSYDDLYRMVHVEFKSYREIAALFGVDYTAVPYWLKKHNIPRHTYAETRSKRTNASLPESLTLERMYVSGMPLDAIAHEFALSRGAIKGLFSKYNLPLRPNGWNRGQRIRCDDGHLVRSSYEVRADNWLANHGITHAYEPSLPFDRHYHADFLANGWYIEIWGVRRSARYSARQEKKRQMYQLYNLPLIDISTWAFDSAHPGLWSRKLSACLIPRTDPLFRLPTGSELLLQPGSEME